MRRVTITQRQLKPLLEQLARREQELRSRIAEEQRRTNTEDYEQLDGVVGDEADRAFVETAIDIETGGVEQQVRELREIEAARERVAQGTFGVCVDCAVRSSTSACASIRPRCAAPSARRSTRIRGRAARSRSSTESILGRAWTRAAR